MGQLKLAKEGKESVFLPTSSSDHKDLSNMYSVKPGVTFHFFTSQIPCMRHSVSLISLVYLTDTHKNVINRLCLFILGLH